MLMGWPGAFIRANIASSIDLVLQMERRGGERIVTELVEVEGYGSQSDKFLFGRTRA